VGVVERRTSEWVDLVGDLLAGSLAAFPHELLSARLHETFGCQVAWSWIDGPGRSGFHLHVPIPGFPSPEVRDVFDRAAPHHPVLRWFHASGDLGPMSIGRVPGSLVDEVARSVLAEHFRPLEAEQQLVVLHRMRGPSVHAFVLSRGGHDFCDADLRAAAALQPLLMLLDRQIAAGAAGLADVATDLTGRELAVLRLLADGRTASAIAAQLLISERTVHRHLQSIYRKLGVHDRVTAVLAGREAALLAPGAR
jgi:DNA-binding CsgD family transcriptional regulator